MYPLILGVHVFISILLIIAVLLQSGKGSSLKEAFGGGSSDMFGANTPENIMNKITTVLVVVFFFTSIVLTVMSSSGSSRKSVIDKLPQAPATNNVPATDKLPKAPLESK